MILGFNAWLLEDFDVVEVGGKRTINVVLSVGFISVEK